MLTGDSQTDALLARLKGGDEEALAELFSFYRDRLWRMVDFRLDERLRGRLDPSDVLQEAYLAAAERLQHYFQKPSMPFFVWLREVTAQRLIDLHRRHLGARKRSASQEVPLSRNELRDNTSASLAMQLVGHLTSPSQVLLRQELVAQLRDVLESMDPIDREVLALRHFEELTNDEVAEVLGIGKSAASNRYVRALTRLKKILERIPGFFDEIDPN